MANETIAPCPFCPKSKTVIQEISILCLSCGAEHTIEKWQNARAWKLVRELTEALEREIAKYSPGPNCKCGACQAIAKARAIIGGK